MKKNSLLYDDEIDLIALFKIIWNGKIKDIINYNNFIFSRTWIQFSNTKKLFKFINYKFKR